MQKSSRGLLKIARFNVIIRFRGRSAWIRQPDLATFPPRISLQKAIGTLEQEQRKITLQKTARIRGLRAGKIAQVLMVMRP